MSYDNPMSLNHKFGEVFDFGGGADVVRYIKGPPGKKGILKSVSVEVNEVFLTGTKTGKVHVGTATDDDAYAALVIPSATADNTVFSELNDTDALIATALPADTLIKVTFVFGTDGGTVSGKGYTSILIDWY